MKTLFKNGTIIDGSGDFSYIGDILIENEFIKQVGKNLTDEVDKVIDCTGLIISPGFIDAHSHNDFFYDHDNSEKYYIPFIKQGITTQITGNCGFSPFGVSKSSKHIDKVGGGLFKANKPSSFKDFINDTEGKLHLNIVPLIGHGTVRISVSGYCSNKLTEEELNQELQLVEEAMSNGAFGGSLGLMYEPGLYAETAELAAFASVLKKYDGILTVHPRACSKVALGFPLISKPHLELALDEVISIMKETGVRVEFSHLIFVGKTSWKSVDTMLEKFKECKEQGYQIGYDNYAFNYGASVITVVLPPWYMAMSKEDRNKKWNIFKLKTMANITKKLLGIDFCDFQVAYISEDHKHYEGKTIDVLAKEEKMPVFDMYLKLVNLSDGKGRIYLNKYYNDEIVKKLMEDENSIFMTDAWLEESGVQNIATFQCFPYFLYKARLYNMKLERIIRKMSYETAIRFKIPERGLLKEGYRADITVFNYEEMEVNFDKPDTFSKGIKHVFINGNHVVEDNKFIKTHSGKLILKK